MSQLAIAKSHSNLVSIPQLLNAAEACYGKQTFLKEGEVTLSFCDFAGRARQVAAALIGRGIQPGDHIAVWAPNCIEWVIAALGVQCSGAVLVTLNTRYKGNEAGYILRLVGAKLLFVMEHFLNCDYPALLVDESLPDLQEIVVFRQTKSVHTLWEDFLAAAVDIPAQVVGTRMAAVGGEDISDILFTSGTTGRPKGVMTCHAQNIRIFTEWGDIVGIREGDRYLAVNPFFHCFGYKAGILVSLIRGATLLPQAVFDSSETLKRIAAEKITVLPGPPTIFLSLLAHPELEKYDISSLKSTATGAAAIPVTMILQMKQRLGFERVITAYGLTESCGIVSMCRANDSAEIIANTSGRALADIELRCVDGNNQELARGEPGEIVLRGYNVMKGYIDNEAATGEAIDSEGWLHTGDIGVMDDQGNLRITDRLKDMFITGGFNCYPAEIENNLSRHPAIAMNAIIGVADKRLGEVAMAFVVLKEGAKLNQTELIGWCREQMANYKVPRYVRFVDVLPLNASGKVMKYELRNMITFEKLLETI